tara:strand:+ start:130 stop:570 length:441 start_codon:yes stop_codon:yes gene_type:complete
LKYLFNIRKGDAIIAGDSVGIVTKRTKNYYYYFFDGHVAKIKKKRLWEYLDSRVDKVSLKYANGTKRRRKQRRMRTLDLHKVRHQDVSEKVRKFLNFVELPCTIVTGKSSKMKEIVKEVVKEYGWSISPLGSDLDGAYVIIEKWEG